MADEIQGSDLLKGKETSERMERDEASTASELAVGLTPQSASAPSGASPNAGAKKSGSGGAESDLPVQGLMVSPEKSTSRTTPPRPEGASKKTDEKKGLGHTIWKATKSLLKISPKKPEKLAIVTIDTSENPTGSSATTASGSLSKKPHKPVRITADESPDGIETLTTDIASYYDSVFQDSERKDSIASCDTGAHIFRLPSLESSSRMELEEDSPEKEDLSDSQLEPSED